ncbi:MAG: hypothetical protein JNL44_07390 [Gemmatimonadetes bacterium]|nr:hypothetical protein [Gemmatimonadota bacterium]
MIGELVALTGWIVLVATGAWIALRERGTSGTGGPSAAVRRFIAVALAMSLLAGFSQRELWPFATWALMPARSPADVRIRALVCVDSADRPFAVDHRAWAPLTEEELLSWIRGPFTRLEAAAQRTAIVSLTERVEAGRVRARGGLFPAAHASPLGRFAASSHLLHPLRWTTPERTPATPCVALRLVERRWNVDSAAAGRGVVIESTLWQLPPREAAP